MDSFIYNIKLKHNLQNHSDIFKFPLVGQYHHEIFYKTLQNLNKDIAKLIYSQKPYKNTTAYISKNYLTITTINAEIGNSLIESIHKIQNIKFNLPISLPQPNNTKSHQPPTNDFTNKTNKQNLKDLEVILTEPQAKINFIAHLIEPYAQTNQQGQQQVQIFIKTPLLISPRYHYNMINYLIKTSIKKVLYLFNNKDGLSPELYKKRLYTDLYKPTFLQIKSKLFSPMGKQSYHGIYGKLELIITPQLATILKLASLTNIGLKASYGYGHMHIK